MLKLPRLEALKLELQSFLDTKKIKEQELLDIEMDIADIQEDLRMELETGYHL